MELRVLGPLEVLEQGRSIAIASPRQRALLALLLIHASRPVSTERILDALWGDTPPESGAGSVAFHVSRLRAALEPIRRTGEAGDAGQAGDPGVITTEPGGYSLRLPPDAVDAVRFERLAREGRDRLADDPATAADRLGAALALWRGEPFADLADQAFLQPEIARLREARLRALEDRFEADLVLGRGRDLVPELEALVAAEPLREHPRAQLMRALYAAGRQADALRVYHEGRRQLAEELGIDPSPELQALELAVLRQDASLDATPGSGRAGTGRATSARAVAGPRNPYKGLRPFGEADATDFFGREALAARLLDRLMAVARAGGLLLVVGPSGSGKSSVLRAGLLPLVRAARRANSEEGAEAWRIVEMLPGSRPEEALARAVRPPDASRAGAVVEAPSDPSAGAAADVPNSASAIAALLARAADDDPRPLLLVIDQLEELFALATDPGVPRRFLQGLAEALAGPGPRPVVVAAIRADWFDRLLLIAELGALVRDGTEVITPLTGDELERAIVRPAAAVGVELEAGLAAALEADVIDRPGALPLLQFALTELFERGEGRRLTREAYAAIGGVAGAIGRRAEGVHAGLDTASQEVARQLFLRLVVVGEASTVAARRVPVDDLRSVAADSDSVDRVLDAFGRSRLLAFDRDQRTGRATAEPAHEALLTHWPRLAGWIGEAREGLWMEGRLEAAAGEWAAAGRDPGFLLGGSRLTLFESWAQATDLRLDTLGRDFLEASLAQRLQAESTERERQDHQRRLERRAATGLRALVVVLVVAVLATSGLLAAVWLQGEGAREDRAVATARELAVASNGALDSDPSLALLLAVESARATADRGWIVEEAMDGLHWALQAARVPYSVSDDPVAVRAGPDGGRGVYLVPPADLVRRAAAGAGRILTDAECRSHLHAGSCPSADLAWARPSLEVRTAAGLVTASELATSSLRGTRVRMAAQLPTDVRALLADFGAGSGIALDAAPAADLASVAGSADIAILVRPDDVATLARVGQLLDLRALLDPTAIASAVGDRLMEPGWVGPRGTGRAADGAGLYGIPLAFSISSLLWYPEEAFREAGYEPPTTWAELEALTAAMVSDGRTPWCLGAKGDPSNPSPPGGVAMRSGEDLVDWVEDLVLRVSAGDPQYELWSQGKLGFQDRSIRAAVRQLDDLIRPEGAVLRGVDGAVLTPHTWAGLRMTAGLETGCWLQHGAATLRSSWPPDQRERVAAVPLPSIADLPAGQLRGRMYTLVVLRDRPEVRALATHLVGDSFATAVARTASRDGLLPVLAVDVSTFMEDFGRDGYELLRGSLPGTFVVDASDRMPAEVGAEALPDGLVRYLQARDDRRDAALDELLRTLDTARARSR